MNQQEKQLQSLRENHVLLTDQLDFSHLKEYFIENEILTYDDCQEIESAPTRKNVMFNFIERLQRCGPNAYPTLLEALKQTKSKHVLDALQATYERLSSTDPLAAAPRSTIDLDARDKDDVEKIYNIPKRIRSFQERPEISNRIKEMLEEENVAILAGIHGCGKTQMSLQYVLQNQDKNGVNWFMETSTFWQGLQSLARKLNIERIAQETWQGLLKRIFENLSIFKKKKIIHHLIFDNLKEEIYKDVLRTSRSVNADNIHVIITSNEREDDFTICMGGFTEDETVKFFSMKQEMSTESEYDIVTLGKTLGNLPLALAAARSYIVKSKTNIKKYQQKLESEDKKIQKALLEQPLSADYDKTLLVALSLNLEELKAELDKIDEDLYTSFQKTSIFKTQVSSDLIVCILISWI